MCAKLSGVSLRLLAGAVALAAANGAASQEDERQILQTICADCHPAIQEFRAEALRHGDSLTCRTCHHVGFSNDPREVRLLRVEQCQRCHQEVQELHTGVGDRAPECTECHSIHGTPGTSPSQVASARCGVCHSEDHPAHAPLAEDAPLCADCHAVHGSPEPQEGAAPTEGCTDCHDAVHPGHDGGEGWFGSVPGAGKGPEETWACTACHAMESGFGFAAAEDPAQSCTECHAGTGADHAGHTTDQASCTECHDIGTSLIGRRGQAAMDARCADCHEEENRDYASGAHASGGAEVATPGCVTCHAFQNGGAGGAEQWRIRATVQCVECHETQATLLPEGGRSRPGDTYRDDFHGATVLFLAQEGESRLTGDDVLLCSDCHGAHGVELMGRAEVAPVCERCHGEAGIELAGAWLGHEPPGPRHATVVWLVQLFYTFLIPFMLIGLFLVITFHLVDQWRKGARMAQSPGLDRIRAWFRGEKRPKPASVTRFSRLERLEHLGSMVTFILLVVTGLPQTRPNLSLAQGIIDVFGGIWATRIVHRVAGVAFVILMVTHVVRAVVGALRRRRLPVMMPVRKDFEDIVQTFRHYREGTPEPKVGKFDFSEKFEYWGLFLGGIVMTASGLVLMFPELVTVLLPGILVAALRTMHGLEATFAVLVVVLWHSYGVIFRPEVFPLDTTIFTGRMSVDRLKHEHPLEYERIFSGGDADTSPEGAGN